VEDIGATQASFSLEETLVTFEHNGRPFSQDDIWGITDIGEGTKAGDEDNIGRFGVGFKAVFAYSETPYIWSPSYSFMISDLVLPTEIPPRKELGQTTRFEFPFNNPKKVANDAYCEIEAALNELAEMTLLFLSHLQSIQWRIGQERSGEVLRIQHSGNHVEIRKSSEGTMTASSHFLRFSEPVEGLERQCVSIAFPLEYLPTIMAFNPREKFATQFKIIPAKPGRVAVFFPAEKESSGLRFHLHAPFVPDGHGGVEQVHVHRRAAANGGAGRGYINSHFLDCRNTPISSRTYTRHKYQPAYRQAEQFSLNCPLHFELLPA